MARFFVTSFTPNSAAHIGVSGFYNDIATSQFATVTVDDIVYDPTLSTSVRQQILDGMIPRINAKLEDIGLVVAPLIATDVEIVS